MAAAIIIVLTVLAIGWTVWFAAEHLVGRKAKARRSRFLTEHHQHRELVELRQLRDHLLNDALDRVEVDPAARVTVDTIRQHERHVAAWRQGETK